MNDEAKKAFDSWFESNYPLTPGGTRPHYQAASVMTLMKDAWANAWQAATLAELERNSAVNSIRSIISAKP